MLCMAVRGSLFFFFFIFFSLFNIHWFSLSVIILFAQHYKAYSFLLLYAHWYSRCFLMLRRSHNVFLCFALNSIGNVILASLCISIRKSWSSFILSPNIHHLQLFQDWLRFHISRGDCLHKIVKIQFWDLQVSQIHMEVFTRFFLIPRRSPNAFLCLHWSRTKFVGNEISVSNWLYIRISWSF